MTATLEGKIKIDTSSLDKAVEQIKSLGDALSAISQNNKSIDALSQSIKENTQAQNANVKAAKQVIESDKARIKSAGQLKTSYSRMAADIQASVASEQQKAEIMDRLSSKYERAKSVIEKYGTSTVRGSIAESAMRTQIALTKDELKRATKSEKENQSAKEEGKQSDAAKIKALGQLTISYERLTAQIAASALSENQKAEATQQLTNLYNSSSTTIRQFGTNTEKGADAQVAFRRQVSNTTETVRQANAEFRGQAIVDFNRKMQDLTSSVQVALGPLSGVASRLSAFAALFRRNTASIAVLIGGFVGFNVALSQTLKVGAEAERQILALDSQIKSAGLSGITSGQQMSEMAHKIAGATLASASGVREAQSTLLAFGNVGVESFERVLLTAQGLSQTFGGDLAQNTSRLGRLLNDPIRNFDALSRQGIQFNEQEREKITSLQRSGQLFKAQEIILARFADLQERATGEARGLSGAMDTLRGNIAVVAESLFMSSGVSEKASEAISKVAEAIKQFGESEQAVTLAENFGKTISAVGSAVEFLVENGQVLAKVLGVVLLAGIARTTSSIGLMIASKLGWKAETDRLNISLRSFINNLNASRVAIIQKTKDAITWRNTLFSFLPVVGVLTLGLQALGVVNIFGQKQRDNIRQFLADLDETSRVSRQTIDSLRDLASFDPELEGKIAIADKISEERKRVEADLEFIKDKLADATSTQLRAAEQGDVGFFDKEINSLERSIEAYSKRQPRVAEAFKQQLEVAKSLRETVVEQENLRNQLTQLTADERKAAKEVREHGAERATANRIIEDGNKAVKEQVESIRAVVDSEGQRIDSLKRRVAEAKEVIEAQKGVEGVDQKYIEQLERDLIPALEREINTLYANSRAKREQMREAQRLARVQSDLSEVISRAAIFEERARGGISDATVEAKLAAIEYEKALVRNTAALQNLNKDSLTVIATKLKMDQATLQEIQSAEDLTEVSAQVAKAYTEQVKRAMEAEAASRKLAEANQVRDTLGDFFFPLDSTKRQAEEMRKVLSAGLEGPELDAALRDVDAWYKEMSERITKGRERMLADTMRVGELGPIESLRRELEDREATLREMFPDQEEVVRSHMDVLEREFARLETFARFDQAFEQAGTVVNESMEVMRLAGRESTKAFQKMAIVQATIAQAGAISKIWQEHAANPVYATALTALAAAKVGAQIASIKAQSFNTGGLVTGRGTSMSDSIPAWLSNGEFVLRASAVRALGVGNVERLNRGEMPRFNQGGSVAPLRSSGSSSGSSGLSLSIINNGQPIEVDRVEENFDEDGQRNLKLFVDSRVKERMADGSLDQSMSQNYRINRRPIRR